MSRNNSILKISDLEELLNFSGSTANIQLSTQNAFTNEDITHVLKLCDAFWLHSGYPAEPHANLTSGECSNGFVDVLRALSYTNVCDILSYHMTHKIESELDAIDPDFESSIKWVIGSDHAAAVFSQNVARWLGARHDFTEKGPDKSQLWKRLAIEPNEMVLQVEELVTTSNTLMAVRKGIREGNPTPVTFAPVVATLVHRSDVDKIEGTPIVYLAHYDFQTWDQKDCPLCKAGSKRIKPKQNWGELTRK